MLTVDPRWGFWISVGLAIFGGLAGATTQLTTLFGEHATSIIVAWSLLVMTIGNGLNAVLQGITSAAAKMSTAAPPAPVPKVP